MIDRNGPTLPTTGPRLTSTSILATDFAYGGSAMSFQQKFWQFQVTVFSPSRARLPRPAFDVIDKHGDDGTEDVR